MPTPAPSLAPAPAPASAPAPALALALALALSVAALLTPATSHAGGLGVCASTTAPNAATQDRLIQVAAVLRTALGQSGHSAAIVARSGLPLQMLGLRYSHAGVALLEGAGTPWAVRQLYFDCDTQKPRLFDQGLAGFVMGVNDGSQGHVSALLLPPEAEGPLRQAALNDDVALSLLGGTYSANAHAFGLRYQNCNQWLAELLATAWGGLAMANTTANGLTSKAPTAPNAEGKGTASGAAGAAGATKATDRSGSDENGPASPSTSARERAQTWLWQHGYRASVLNLTWYPLVSLGKLSPWLNTDDHPPADVAAAQFRVSMPEGLADWVRAGHPGTTRLELCYTPRQVVLRRGWLPLGPECEAQAGDEVHPLVTD